MSGTEPPPESSSRQPSGDQIAGFVTQAQLAEVTHQITLSVRQQLDAFSNELLRQIHQARPANGQDPPLHQERYPEGPQPPPSPHQRMRSSIHAPPRPRRKAHFEDSPSPPDSDGPSSDDGRSRRPSSRRSRKRSLSADRDRRRHKGKGIAHSPLPRSSPDADMMPVASGYDRYYQPLAEALGGNTPLSDRIMNARSRKFKMPVIDKYRGDGDPAEHIQNYYDMMVVLHAPEETICKCFPITLADSARRWWNGLPKRSIHSFRQLSRKFVHHFMAGAKRKLPPYALIQTRQQEGESLRDYIKRFQQKRLEVEDPGNRVAMASIVSGLLDNELADSLAKKHYTSYEQMMAKAHGYMDMEDARAYKVAAKAAEAAAAAALVAVPPSPIIPATQPAVPAASPLADKKESLPRPPPRWEAPRGPPRSDNIPNRNNRRESRRQQAPQPPLTALNTTLTEALYLVQKEGLLTGPPPQMRSNPNRRDTRQYCRYHQDHGHLTNDCRILKRDIEDLIQRGYMKKLVASRDRREPARRDDRDDKRRSRSRSPRPQQQQQPPVQHQNPPTASTSHKGVIMAISGGPAAGGSSNNARKRYAKRALQVDRGKKPRSGNVITFDDSDLEGVETPHDDPIIINAQIDGFLVKRVMVDTGSSADILYVSAFDQMGIDRSSLQPCLGPIVGFTGHAVEPLGLISLPLTVGEPPCQSTVQTLFLVMNIQSAYNAILGRSSLNNLQAISSTYHQMIKFPTPMGVGVARSNQKEARSCYILSMKGKGISETLPIEKISLRMEKELERERTLPVEELQEIPLGQDEARTVKIGSSLEEPQRSAIISCLRANADVFAWGPEDMPGIPPEVICHELSIDPHTKPIRQKKRHLGAERQKAAAEEVDRLLRAGFIREVRYPDWLSNVVLVKKKSNKWRMCTDFTDLNKACPKDSYPLPRIDQLVDDSAGHALLSFMDAFSGYNQILMAEHDQEKTAFITDQGTYCFRVMPFGLKNAGATYQRLVNKIFKAQLGRNVEAYVDDILVKSKQAPSHVADLEETFAVLRRYRMKLNPAKCAFGVQSGKFLGFMITQRGIEINPEKIAAVEQLPEPRTVKDVQRLNGKIAALGRFLSRSAERSLPFFKILRGSKEEKKKLEWTAECSRAFQELKTYLSTKPLLSSPKEGEILYLYLAVSHEAVSAALVREEGHIQKPVYYVSRILKAGELNYPLIEKASFLLVLTARRLRPYFQAHTIIVTTNFALKKALSSPTTSGRMIAWSVELSEYDIQFEPRKTIKAQALADFFMESTEEEAEPEPVASPDASTSTPQASAAAVPILARRDPEYNSPEFKTWWLMRVDGSSGETGSGAGIVLCSPQGIVHEISIAFAFSASNNEAEYEALLAGLRAAIVVKAERIYILTDSQLVVRQVKGDYAAKDSRMASYLKIAKELLARFVDFKIAQIPRSLNARADALSKLGATSAGNALGPVHTDTLEQSSISKVPTSLMQVESTPEPSWMDPFIRYLTQGALPDDAAEAKRLRRNALRYLMMDGALYRMSYSSTGVGPYLRCLRPAEAKYVLSELHEGTCGNHPGARTLAQKVIRQGYYWPTILAESRRLVSHCKQCQRFASIPRAAPTELTPILSPIPFAQWGLDLLGPFPIASGQRRFLIVAIDYFTKWIEAEPLAKIAEGNITSFAWKSIVCRFGVPHAFITDNGTQFTSQGFQSFCKEWNIRLKFASVAHPKCNGLAEAANKCILQALKKKVGKSAGSWVDELPSILWSYRTTHKNSTGETPFKLTYGAEAVTPVEVGMPTIRLGHFDEDLNNEGLQLNLDLLDEVRGKALRTQILNQQRIARHYNAGVRPRRLTVGDQVLRRAIFDKDTRHGKLTANWEGPYTVIEELRPGTYRLRSHDGRILQHPWNIEHLRRYHQ